MQCTLVLKLAEIKHITSDIRKEFYARPSAQITPEKKRLSTFYTKKHNSFMNSKTIMKAQVLQ